MTVKRFQIEVASYFFGSAMLAFILWGILLLNNWCSPEKTLVGIPMLSLTMMFLGNFYQKKPEPVVYIFAVMLGWLSPLFLTAYMMLGK